MTDPSPQSTLEQLQQMAARAQAAAADGVPTIELPHSGEVTLLRGITVGDGRFETQATVRELNGADEEAIAKYNLEKGTMSEFISLILSRAVVSIGDFKIKDNPLFLESLIAGDRDLLFLAIIKATYGDSKEFDMQCPACQGDNTVRLNIDQDFPLRKTDVDPQQNLFVELRNGAKVELRLPTGVEQKQVGRSKHPSLSEANTHMLSLCVETVDGQKILDTKKWARELGMADRRKLVQALIDAPGPSVEEVTVPCASCGQELTVPMDWASLLWA